LRTLLNKDKYVKPYLKGAVLEFLIKSLESSDWEPIREIYLEGLATGQATFETEAPSQSDWDEGHLPFGRIAAISQPGDRLIGWAALSGVSKRKAYAGVAEVSVYVATAARAKGVGRALLEALIAESEQHGIWTLQASIFPENQASLKLHETLGFRRVGRRMRISRLNGVWRDTVILERRSERVGVD
jgi:phosphinothricin acetyltransferase